MGKSLWWNRELRKNRLGFYGGFYFSFQALPSHSFFEIQLYQSNCKNTEEKNYSRCCRITILTLFHHCISDVINNCVQIVIRSWLSIEQWIQFTENLKAADCIYNANKEDCWRQKRNWSLPWIVFLILTGQSFLMFMSVRVYVRICRNSTL